ncbi:MAG: ATP-binding protein [Saprospiraceae bacterium]
MRFSLFLLVFLFLQLSLSEANPYEKNPGVFVEEPGQKKVDFEEFTLDSLSHAKQVPLLIQVANDKKEEDPAVAMTLAEEAVRLANNFGMKKELAEARYILETIRWKSQKSKVIGSQLNFTDKGIAHLQDSIGKAAVDIQIGDTYLKQKHYEDAEFFYDRAIRVYESINYSEGVVDVNIALAELHFQKEDWGRAKGHIRLAQKKAEPIAYEEGVIQVLTMLGKLSLKNDDQSMAMAKMSVALQRAKVNNNPHQLIKILPLMAEAMLDVPDKKEEAEKFLMESLELTKAMEMPSEELNALAVLARLYEKNQSFEKAYQIEKRRFELSKSIASEENSNSITEILISYLTKEKRINELQRFNEALASKRDISQLYQISAYIVIISIFIIIAILYSRLKVQFKSHALLEEKNKELLETNSALERFAYVASHDLKEPLRTISSFTSLIARKYEPVLDNKGKKYIKFVTDGVAHMNYLLEDLLRYSRLVNKKDFVSEPVNLNQIVAEVKNVLGKKIDESNAQIQCPEMPVVYSNSLHMHQLFQNLIANGLKFNDKSDPRVEISCLSEDDRYLIGIKDNGIGIDKQYHDKVFEMFQRLSKTEYAGTGIGLSICQKIIEMNDGKMWLESDLGEGTTVYFYLRKDMAN